MRRAGLGLLVLALLMSSSFAQDIERIQPKTLPGNTVEPVIAADSELGVESAASEEVLGTISGIALLGTPDEVQVDNPPEIRGVEVLSADLEVPAQVTAALEPYIGEDLSISAIQYLTRDVVLAYRKANLPVVDVGVPEQNVSTGVLQLVVVVGKVGDVSVTGNTYFDDNKYLRRFSLQPGDLIWQPSVLADLRYISRNPFRNVHLFYTPGDEFGEADIILNAEEQRPFSAYVGFENTGNEFIGTDRWNFGFEAGNFLNLDHLVAYQYTTPIDFEGLHAHSMIYRIPIDVTRGEFRFLGGYVEAENDFESLDTTLTSIGQSVQLSGIYVNPLPRWGGWEQELHLGYDFKSTNNNLEFGGLDLIDTNAEIHQFFLGHTGKKETGLGLSSFSHRFVWSPGSLSGHNEDDIFEQLRAGASADYFYWTGSFSQLVPLPNDFRFLTTLEGQFSNANLLPSESLILGGIGSVRGFEQNITRADEGIIFNAELYTPAMTPLTWLGLGQGKTEPAPVLPGAKNPVVEEPVSLDESLRFFAFYDYGWGSNLILLPDEPDDLNLGGLGIGLDYRLEDNFVLRTAYGWQVAQSGFEDEENARWHVSATVRW